MSSRKRKKRSLIRKNAGQAYSQELIDAIRQLPGVKTKRIAASLIGEFLWRDFLGKPLAMSRQELEVLVFGARRNEDL